MAGPQRGRKEEVLGNLHLRQTKSCLIPPWARLDIPLQLDTEESLHQPVPLWAGFQIADKGKHLGALVGSGRACRHR